MENNQPETTVPTPSVNSTPPQSVPTQPINPPTKPIRPTTMVPPTPTTNKSNNLLFAGVGFTIVLLIVGSYFAFSMILKRNETPPPTNVPDIGSIEKQEKSKLLPQTNALPIVAFVSEDTSTASAKTATGAASIHIYDLSAKKEIPTDTSKTFATITMGSWSPTGQYLPILTTTKNATAVPLFIFDLTLKKINTLIADTTTNSLLKNNTNSFLFQSYWKDAQTLIYGPEYISTNPPRNLVTIDLSGNVGTISAQPHTFTLRNQRLAITYNFSFAPTGRIDVIDKMTLDGKNLNFTPVGTPIGISNNSIITLVSPKPKTLIEQAGDKDFKAQIAKLKTPADVEKANEDYLAPKGNSAIHIYDSNGVESKNFAINFDNWIIVSAQTRNPEGTIILHETDKFLKPTKSRFVEINPLAPEQQRAIIQIDADTIHETNLSGFGSFGISADGNWLVYYEPSQTTPNNYSISAIHLESLEKQSLCKDHCSNLRVFNPFALTYR